MDLKARAPFPRAKGNTESMCLNGAKKLTSDLVTSFEKTSHVITHTFTFPQAKLEAVFFTVFITLHNNCAWYLGYLIN